MIINHNLMAMNAGRQFNIVEKGKAKCTEKLSSGYRINRAADDAAGLSISEKMRRQIRGLGQGIENTQDGVSLCQIADGALNEVHDMLHRLEELSVQAANGTNTETDRQAVQEEIDQILSEIDRISITSTFNEQRIFGDGREGTMSAAAAARMQMYGTAQASAGGGNAIQTYSMAQKAAGNHAIQTYGVAALAANSAVCGDFTVTGGTLGTDYTFSGGVLTILSSAAVTIQNTNPAVATANRIEVADGVNANITLAGVNIDVSNIPLNAAFKITDNSKGNVTVTLFGENTLKSGSNCAGLQKGGGTDSGTLTIKGTGILYANGGKYGAGIGGSADGKAGNIIINSGTINAQGGECGAGIGGGGTGRGENITISGGTVNAQGGSLGAGIGGGMWGAGNNITISGGTVNAQGGRGSAGIGGSEGRVSSNITISGRNTVVSAKGGDGGEDIGSGGNTTNSTSANANRNGGLIIEGNTGKIYGDVELKSDVTIDSGVTLNIDGDPSKNSTLTVTQGVTLTNNGTIIIDSGDRLVVSGTLANDGSTNNNGAITNNGTISGNSVSGNAPDNGTGGGNLPGGSQSGSPSAILPVKSWWIQSGSESAVGMFVEIESIDTLTLGIYGMDVTTEESAGRAITMIAGALEKVSSVRSKIGAQQNRLEHTIANESNIVENTTEAESRIRDADIAKEVVALSTANILAQAGVSVMTQANRGSEGVLTLLQ